MAGGPARIILGGILVFGWNQPKQPTHTDAIILVFMGEWCRVLLGVLI